MDREIPLDQRRKEKIKSVIRYSAIGAVVIILFIVLMNLLEGSLSRDHLIIAEVDEGTIEVTINASGKVIPLTEEIIVSPINSRILEVYKNPGNMVEEGEPILKLELASVETDYKQKLDEKQMKIGKLTQVKVNLDNDISELKMQQKVKDMNLRQMYTELKNEKYLDSIGASTSDKVRQAELNYEVAKLELEQLKQKIENDSQKAAAEIRVQELDLSIFEKSLEQSARLLKDARILSPQRATLTYINNQIGTRVSEGTQIAIISDLTNFKVEASIADGYAEKLASGAKAIIKAGQVQLTGTVINITPSVKDGAITFSVILDDPGHARLRSGLKTEVYVTHGIQDNAIRLPNTSYYMGKGDYELWVVEGDKAEKRTVKLGDCSFEYVEVISGLNPGEKVIISDMNRYREKETLKIK